LSMDFPLYFLGILPDVGFVCARFHLLDVSVKRCF